MQIKFEKRGRVAEYNQQPIPTVLGHRGVSLIQAPPEVLCANSFFRWRK